MSAFRNSALRAPLSPVSYLLSPICYLLFLPLLLYGREGKSYYYPEIRTEVRLLPDGDARIIQQRTYTFKGAFSWATIDLEKQGSAGIVFNRLAELTPAGWQTRLPELSDSPQSLGVRWAYSAKDETRTFLLDYTVKSAVRRYRDVAEFYWKVIEDEHQRVRQAAVDIILPESSPELFKVYIHSAAVPGTLEIDTNHTQASIRQSGIPENTFLEVRALFVPFIFTGITPSDSPRYQEVLKDERRNFLVSRVRILGLIPLGLVLVIIVPLVLLLAFYLRYGREPRLDYAAIYEREPPRPAPPLVVPAILHQKPEPNAMARPLFQAMFATLLDLCRKGVVAVEETREGHRRHYQFRLKQPEAVARLDPYSRQVIDYFFSQAAAAPGVVTEASIRSYNRARTPQVKRLLAGFLDQALAWWQQAMGAEFTSLTSRAARARFLVIAALLILAGAALVGLGAGAIMGTNQYPWILAGILAAVFGAINLVSSQGILRWTDTAFLEHRRWLNFRKFLRDFSALEQAPVALLPIWEQYYVYAAALGVAEHFLRNITRLAEQQGHTLLVPAWYVAAGGPGPATGFDGLSAGLAGFQNFAANFSNMMSSFSTASTSGGGFAGGGGGGGGGGSSGAG